MALTVDIDELITVSIVGKEIKKKNKKKRYVVSTLKAPAN